MARRRHSNRRRRRGNFGFLYKLLSVLVICAAVVMALTLFFRVDTIEVTGTERYTEKDVIEASGIQLGDNLFLLNKYEAARSIAEQLPYIDIEDIRIRRELPDTLLIDVAECGTPLAVIQDGSAWLLSPKGKIVEQLPASQAGDYAVIDGCELLAPLDGHGHRPVHGVRQSADQSAGAAGGAGRRGPDGTGWMPSTWTICPG